MTRTATWKAFALAAALTGAGMFGAAAATAEPKTIGSGSSTSRSSDSVRGGSGKTGLSDSTSQSTRKTKIPSQCAGAPRLPARPARTPRLKVRRGLTGRYYPSPAIRTSA